MATVLKTWPSERAYRLAKIAERGDVPHAYVPGEKKLGLIACAICTRYRAYFAHDADLREPCGTCGGAGELPVTP